MKLKYKIYKGLALSASAVLLASCSGNYLETTPTQFLDENTVQENMQKDPTKVQAYVNGAYMNLYLGGDYQKSHDDFGLRAIQLATDLMCDDVAYHRNATWFRYDYALDFRKGDERRPSSSWNQLYAVIDNANTIIQMLKTTDGSAPTNTTAKIMLGEAYSLRAYSYFWLVNLWQHPYSVAADKPGVPLKTEEEYRQERVPVKDIYTQILADIEKGYTFLKGEGFHNSKVGLSEYAAAAIYANVLLFTGDNANAAAYAKIAAEAGTLNSATEMLSGFNSLSMPEVLWGYAVTNETTGYYASFFSHVDSYMVGYGGRVGFRKLIASELYDKINANDVRKGWFGYNAAYNAKVNVDFEYETTNNLLPYLQNKFRDAYVTGTGDTFTSDIIYFRSGEMYFVAAEAYYLAGDEANARTMLNTVMSTRISGYNFTGSGTALYDEICLQKRIETWMEGNRYLDVKRRNETIDRSLSTNHAINLSADDAVTFSARDRRMIYHIPNTELENNPAISSSDDNE